MKLTAAAVCFLREGALEKLLELLQWSDSTPMKLTYTSSAKTAASFCPVSCLPVLTKAKMLTLWLTYDSIASKGMGHWPARFLLGLSCTATHSHAGPGLALVLAFF